MTQQLLDYYLDANPDKTTSTDVQEETAKPANPDDLVITAEELHTISSIVVDTEKVSTDQDTQEPGSQRESEIQYGHYTHTNHPFKVWIKTETTSFLMHKHILTLLKGVCLLMIGNLACNSLYSLMLQQ